MAPSPTVDFGLTLDWSSADLEAHFTPEKLLRLHPHWHVGDIVTEKDGWSVQIKNHETETPFELRFRLLFPECDGAQACLRIALDHAPASALVLKITDGAVSAQLEDYAAPAEVEPYQMDLWLRGIYGYLSLYGKNTLKKRFDRFVMNRYLLPMNPSQRKISIMIYRFTVLEVVVILILAAGYAMFMR